jgi:hypothetical protein
VQETTEEVFLLVPVGDGREQEEVSTPYLFTLELSGDFQMPGVPFPISRRFSDLRIITHPTSNSSTNISSFFHLTACRVLPCSIARQVLCCDTRSRAAKISQSLAIQLHWPFDIEFLSSACPEFSSSLKATRPFRTSQNVGGNFLLDLSDHN